MEAAREVTVVLRMSDYEAQNIYLSLSEALGAMQYVTFPGEQQGMNWKSDPSWLNTLCNALRTATSR